MRSSEQLGYLGQLWAGTREPPSQACGAHHSAHLCLQLNYTRPGLPTLNPQLLEAWKNEVKEKGHVNCPNDVSWGELVG